MIKFNLNQNEQIVLVVRKHWIAIIGQVIMFFVAAIVPLLSIAVLAFFIPNFYTFWTGDLFYFSVFIYATWLMIFWIAFFYAWTTYHLDIWVVTTHRIFIVEQKGMFYRDISSLTLDKIQDLTIDIDGFLATMLKFGDILVETAGEHQYFKFINANHPEAMKVAINNVQKDFYNRPQPVAPIMNTM